MAQTLAGVTAPRTSIPEGMVGRVLTTGSAASASSSFEGGGVLRTTASPCSRSVPGSQEAAGMSFQAHLEDAASCFAPVGEVLAALSVNNFPVRSLGHEQGLRMAPHFRAQV